MRYFLCSSNNTKIMFELKWLTKNQLFVGTTTQ